MTPDKPIDELQGDPNIKLTPDHVLTFGKYKGRTLKDVYLENPGYLVWAENNIETFWVDWRSLKEEQK